MPKKRSNASKGKPPRTASRGQREPRRPGGVPERVYKLDVFITGGPVTEDFIEANPVLKRTIEIRGDQTLAQLHGAIFKAFDREEEHLYEFQFGKGFHDANGPRYGLGEGGGSFFDGADLDEGYYEGDVATTTLDSLGLEVGRSFGYWFDFGDDWYHQINVEAIEAALPKVRYPRVVARVGQSPPQYLDYDDEEDWPPAARVT